MTHPPSKHAISERESSHYILNEIFSPPIKGIEPQILSNVRAKYLHVSGTALENTFPTTLLLYLFVGHASLSICVCIFGGRRVGRRLYERTLWFSTAQFSCAGAEIAILVGLLCPQRGEKRSETMFTCNLNEGTMM